MIEASRHGRDHSQPHIQNDEGLSPLRHHVYTPCDGHNRLRHVAPTAQATWIARNGAVLASVREVVCRDPPNCFERLWFGALGVWTSVGSDSAVWDRLSRAFEGGFRDRFVSRRSWQRPRQSPPVPRAACHQRSQTRKCRRLSADTESIAAMFEPDQKVGHLPRGAHAADKSGTTGGRRNTMV